MKRLLLLSFFIFLIPTTQAYSGLFSILNETYVDSINDLPISDNLTVNKNVSQHYIKDKEGYWLGTLSGWIDLIGFSNLSKYNGTYFTSADPEKSAIIQHGTSYSFTKKCGQCYLDSMNTSKYITSTDSNITAWLNITMLWYQVHWVWCGDGCWYPIYELHIDYLNTSDTEAKPYSYSKLNHNYSLNITEYNNSVPKTTIYVPNVFSYVKTIYRYGTENLTHYTKLAHVEQADNGLYFANLSDVDFWTNNTKNLRHFSKWVIIPNTSRPDYSNFTVEVSNLYESRIVENATINRITYRPEKTFSNPLIIFILTILTFLVTSIIVTRRL